MHIRRTSSLYFQTISLLVGFVLPIHHAHGSEKLDDFDKILEGMIAHSFDREQARAQTELVKAQGVGATELWSPRVSLTGKEARSQMEDSFGTSRSVGVNGTLNLYRFGADRLAQSAAKLDESAATDLESKVMLDVHFKSSRLLLLYLRLLLESDVVKEAVSLRERSLAIAQARFKSGLIPAQEVQKVEIDFELARGSLSTNTTALQEALLNIAVARQQSPDEATKLRLEHRWPWLGKLKDLSESAKKATNYVDILNGRPDYQANQNRLRASTMRVDEARRRSFPRFDLALGYDINRDNQSELIQRGWNGLLSVTVPISDGGDARSAIQARIAAEKSLELEASALRTELPNALASTEKSLAESYRGAQSRERILATSEKLHETTLTRFQKGLISANELNDDYRRLLDTKVAAISTWADAHEKMLAYCQARGKVLSSCN